MFHLSRSGFTGSFKNISQTSQTLKSQQEADGEEAEGWQAKKHFCRFLQTLKPHQEADGKEAEGRQANKYLSIHPQTFKTHQEADGEEDECGENEREAPGRSWRVPSRLERWKKVEKSRKIKKRLRDQCKKASTV